MTNTSAWTPRPLLRDIRAYDIDPAPCELALADNTSQFGAPPSALRALSEGIGDRVAGYPTTYSHALREAIARYIGVAPQEVMVGCGSDEVMGCAFRALANPGDVVAYMDPTFVMARVFALTNSLQPRGVPLDAHNDADADALVAAAAPITYVCTPNNPTGMAIGAPALAHVLEKAHGLVFLDEAYAEFAGSNLAALAPSRRNLLVFRTFSKAFGLAGARVGFAVGSRPLIAELEKVRGPYTVTALSERAALAAVSQDLEWVARCVAEVRESRDRFLDALRAAGFSPLPSDANFVLVPVHDAPALMRGLRTRGILVRHFTALPRIGDALRITVGPWPVMQRVLEALPQVDRAATEGRHA